MRSRALQSEHGTQVDLEKKRVIASIVSLVAAARANAGALRFVHRLRAELGHEVHRRVRFERQGQEGYRAEVPVELVREVDGFTARVRGRVDGLIDDGSRLTIEEIKSVSLTADEMDRLTAAELPDFCLQVRLYALCLRGAYPGRRLGARLLLVSVVDAARRWLEIELRPEETAETLDALVRSAIAGADAVARRSQALAACAAELVFPYPSLRPHQGELMEAIGVGLDSGRPVLAVAPTGIGKTVSALLAGLRFSLGKGGILYFLTAKRTQQELVARTFEDITAASGTRTRTAVRATTLAAKERMCPPGDLRCHLELCPYLADFGQRVLDGGALDTLLGEAPHLGSDRVLARGEALELCPYELSLCLAARVDVVICDYNYVYDPLVSSVLGLDIPGARPAVVILDEAHNLFDRSREYYSPFFGVSSIRAAEGRTRRLENEPGFSRDSAASTLLSELREFCGTLNRYIGDAVRSAVESGVNFVGGCAPIDREPEPWQRLGADAARLLVRYAVRTPPRWSMGTDDPLAELLGTVLRTRDAVLADDPGLISYISTPQSPRGSGVGVLCVDPARPLQQRHERVLGTVAMSATLDPVEYYADVLGFGPLHPKIVRAPSPFPPENQQVLIVPTVDTTLRRRDAHCAAIARIIRDVIALRDGHYITFFPSFAFLEKVRQQLRLPPEQVLVQTPGMPEALRRKTMQRLRGAPGPVLLLAVTGGIFAEGIDLPGAALIGAIVVGPALPAVAFERQLMRWYYDERSENGFAYAMLYPGMQRVVQAAGRVIRSAEDRGVVVLLGRRLAEPEHLECLPAEWYRYDPRELIAENPIARLVEFWAEHSRAVDLE